MPEVFPIKIISKHGIEIKSILTICLSEYKTLYIQWRSFPVKIGCELLYLKKVINRNNNLGFETQISLLFSDNFELLFDCGTKVVQEGLCNILVNLMDESLLKEKENDEVVDGIAQTSNQHILQSLRFSSFQAAIKQEELLQLCISLQFKEGAQIVDKYLSKTIDLKVASAFEKWTNYIKQINSKKMHNDRFRWRLHAISNHDLDLQAWYHAIFYQEVYRLRGRFWYRDAVLPNYRYGYDLVDNALSPLEEAALTHVLCSPETSYGDVAGQMFVVQAIAGNKIELFTLFQTLTSTGITIVKYPRSGRPAKKSFRISFVDGNLYLTWKGKFGNQGVDLGEVTAVLSGINTDILRKSGDVNKANLYLSLMCVNRSVDLIFETEKDRNNWKDLLDLLVIKERGCLENIEPVLPFTEESLFEWLLLYICMGNNCVIKEKQEELFNNANYLKNNDTS